MGRKAGIDIETIVETAARIADRDGFDSLTLSGVATELGIKTPSLYNHVDGLSGLRRLLAFHAASTFGELATKELDGLEGADALRAVAHVDRKFAREHPGLYDSFLPAPRPGEDDELYQALAAPVYTIAHVMLDMGIAETEAVHLIRGFRALLHGFLDLEGRNGFGLPVDLDTSYNLSVEIFIAGILAGGTSK